MIPPEIQDYETYIVSYSGGKDSTATLLWALDNLPREQLRIVFCNTGAEWPETYEYLHYIERNLNIEIERIRAGILPTSTPNAIKWSGTLFDMIRARRKWPGGTFRYCTKHLKVMPIVAHSAQFPHSLNLSGVRATESVKRANYSQFQQSDRRKDHITFFPILHWTERQVWDYLRAHHILPNPIYNHTTRCSCWCCFMARPIEVLNFCRLHPHIAQQAADLEKEINHNWTKHHTIGNLLRQAQAQIPLFNMQPRFITVPTKFNRTASDPAGTTPAIPPATPLAGCQQVRQRKDAL